MKNKSPLIAPSILSADFCRLGDEIQSVAKAGADWIHIDVMDGHFVPNITIGPLVVESIAKLGLKQPLDVHLMIEQPNRYIKDFIRAGANYLSLHVEASIHLHRDLQLIRSEGAKAGVVLNPATPVASIQHVLEMVDFVLLMSVNPGFGGQSFIPDVLEKCSELEQMRKSEGHKFLIEVDGGVNDKTGPELLRRGVDVLVAGNYIFKSSDYKKSIASLRAGAKK